MLHFMSLAACGFRVTHSASRPIGTGQLSKSNCCDFHFPNRMRIIKTTLTKTCPETSFRAAAETQKVSNESRSSESLDNFWTSIHFLPTYFVSNTYHLSFFKNGRIISHQLNFVHSI